MNIVGGKTVYHIGTSGWHYDDWRQRFYPPKLPRADWLGFYAERFDTVELNNSFYRLPSEKAFGNWRDSTPAGFCFAVKASRYITHVKRLKDAEEPVEKFMERAEILGDKLGPMLYQLPPNMHRDDERLEGFLKILPGKIKSVVEFRHDSWLKEEVFDILRGYGAGLCVFDMPLLRCPLAATAGFAYIRFHGSEGLYSSSYYSDEEMAEWAGRLAALAVNDMYIYFNNDVSGYALDNAGTIRRLLAGEAG